MLDSILECKPRKITLDRLKYKNDNNEIIFTNEVEHIERIANKYYQNIGTVDFNSKRFSKHRTLPSPQNRIYLPKPNIPILTTEELDAQITMNELQDVLKSLPNNKAPGTSGISYDIIKKLSPEFHPCLLDLYNFIFIYDVIPQLQTEAFLYPIPKPTWWNNNIEHTHLIVLLDTFRKTLAKIMNTHLNYYLSNNAILQLNNLAEI